MFLFASQTDTFGQVILEAQASGLPVVAVDEGGPASLIDDGETGLLATPDPEALAAALLAITAPAARPSACARAAWPPSASEPGTARWRSWRPAIAASRRGRAAAAGPALPERYGAAQ